MPRKEIGVGSIFFWWKVLDKVPNHGKEKHWRCLCICGEEREVAERGLLRGTSKSCGCYQKTMFWRKLPSEVALFRELYRKYKKQGEERNFSFELTEDEFKKLIFQNCHYCGSAPSNKATHRWSGETLDYNGIDRIDNLDGYLLNNCVSCCKICNVMKNNLPLEVFLNHINTISKKHPRG